MTTERKRVNLLYALLEKCPKTFSKFAKWIRIRPKNLIIFTSTWDRIFALIQFLNENGIQISISPEYYRNGINWCWQLQWYRPRTEWTDFYVGDGTSLYGDNHEFPTMESAYKAAILIGFKKLEAGIKTGKPEKKKRKK